MADKAAEKTALQAEREAVDLELAQLQLEDLREKAEQRRAIRAQKARNQIAYQSSLDENNLVQKLMQDGCSHRKGGKNLEGMLNGQSGYYAVVKHTLPLGEQMVVCQRCTKVWERPIKADFKTAAEYKVALEEYKRAINFPTDNEPSGTRMFVLTADAA